MTKGKMVFCHCEWLKATRQSIDVLSYEVWLLDCFGAFAPRNDGK